MIYKIKETKAVEQNFNKAAYESFYFGFALGAQYSAILLSNKPNDLGSPNSYPEVGVYSFTTEEEKITINYIRKDDNFLELNWPLSITLDREDDLVFAINEELSIYGIGFNNTDAMDDFNRSFLHFWKYYNEISDDKVIGYARRLKVLFREIVRQK
jgi:hypothetical protein